MKAEFVVKWDEKDISKLVSSAQSPEFMQALQTGLSLVLGNNVCVEEDNRPLVAVNSDGSPVEEEISSHATKRNVEFIAILRQKEGATTELIHKMVKKDMDAIDSNLFDSLSNPLVPRDTAKLHEYLIGRYGDGSPFIVLVNWDKPDVFGELITLIMA